MPIVANIDIHYYRDSRTIGLNFETLTKLHTLLLDGFDDFVSLAPAEWKKDGFLQNNKPIIITSRYGQNASIALEDNQDQEANDWNSERDYSKIAYLTFALATSIESVFTFIPYISLSQACISLDALKFINGILSQIVPSDVTMAICFMTTQMNSVGVVYIWTSFPFLMIMAKRFLSSTPMANKLPAEYPLSTITSLNAAF
jgi:hypothetical protein